ncbi:MAG: TRAP transporter small permease [Planctomycetota bacterium]|nr:TRAP transporter small permease [Planctomycetota bacterium]
MGNATRTVNRWLHRLMLWVADVALLSMVAIVTLAVTLRYVFNTGLGWAEEVPRLLVTLFAFLAMAMGVRDHAHIGVNIIYNLFPRDGRARRAMTVFADLVVLVCGLFMLYYGTARCLQLYKLPGKLPMTGLATWWQYLPIPLGGFFISFDSILFLTGVLGRNDLLYTEPEVDYAEELRRRRSIANEGVAE